MYPFKNSPGIVKNRWYIAAFSEEVTRQPLERTLLGLPIVLYRTEAGLPVAMYGICPHRYYPLARGRIEGDALVCGYHGFTFAADGRCVRIPAQSTGAKFCQPTYRAEQRGPFIWIWMGDPANCDPDLIPPYDDFGLDQPGWTTCAQSYFLVNGRPQLLIENLMDLTHLPFLHTQVRIADAFLQGKIEIEQRRRSLQLRRPSRMPWTPFHELLYTTSVRFDGMSSMASITDFYGPEFIRTSGPITSALDGMDHVPDELGTLWILHGITPATDRSTHYFGLMTRNFRLGVATLDETLRQVTTGVRKQDVDAIEAIEERLESASDRQHELLCKADAPAAQVRRLMQKMLDHENAST